MRSLCLTTSLLVVLCVAAPATRAAELPDGQYELNIVAGGKTTYCIIKIETKDDKLMGEVIATRAQIGEVRVTAVAESADGLRLVLSMRTGPAQFIGSAGDERGSRGTFTLAGRTTLAWLEPTDKTTLPAVQKPLPEQADFVAIVRGADAKERVEKLIQFAAEHGDSPLVFDAYRTLIAGAKQAELGSDQVAKAAEQYAAAAEKWSPKWHEETMLGIAAALAQAEMLPELAIKYVEQAKKSMGHNVSAPSQRTIDLTSAIALTQLGKLDEAEKLLTKLNASTPTDVEVLFRLGQVHEKSGNLDGAIELWLPIFTNRSVAAPLRDVWLKKHRNLNGFEAKLDEIYEKNVPPLDVTKFAGRQSKSANGTVLMELFTGAMCPPCVAADVAFDALLKSYGSSEVVFLEYHMHIPGPDPMTNPDAETRFKYYAPDARGTPATFFNGKSEAPGGGLLANARKKYDEYRAAIDSKLEATATGNLKLRVFGDGESVKIETEVSGLTGDNKPLPESLKLRLVVVEEIVRYPGTNGIWQSHRVVRNMPGGAEGIAIKKDNFANTEVVNVADVRKALAEYVNDYEANSAKQRNYIFPDKPLKLQHLRVIAFVQDDATKEVLLTAEAPVEVE